MYHTKFAVKSSPPGVPRVVRQPNPRDLTNIFLAILDKYEKLSPEIQNYIEFIEVSPEEEVVHKECKDVKIKIVLSGHVSNQKWEPEPLILIVKANDPKKAGSLFAEGIKSLFQNAATKTGERAEKFSFLAKSA